MEPDRPINTRRDHEALPRVDVVVVSYNSASELRSCVEPLAHERDVHVTVVDNDSHDDSVAVVSDLSVTIVESGKNLGFGAGCNIGWRRGDAPFVLFLNPDARLDAAGVSRLANVLERTEAGAVSPRIVDAAGNLEWSLRRFPQVRSIFAQAFFAHRLFPYADWADEVIRDPTLYEYEHPCEWASGACLLVRRDVLERIEGFDESFFMYAEDVDLCRRLWNEGRPVVYTPSVEIMHLGGASAPRWRLLPVLAASRIRYARKHLGRVRAIMYRCGVAIGSLTHALAGRGHHRRLGHAQAFIRAIRAGRN